MLSWFSRSPCSSSPVSMLGATLLVGTLLVGCGVASTPTGPLGKPLTFSEYKQELVQAGAQEPEATQHQATFRLGESKAELHLVWQSVQPQTHSYLTSVAVEVAKADPNISITMGNASNPINIGTTEAAIEQRSLLVSWHRQGWLQTQSGTVNVNFAANGEWTIE